LFAEEDSGVYVQTEALVATAQSPARTARVPLSKMEGVNAVVLEGDPSKKGSPVASVSISSSPALRLAEMLTDSKSTPPPPPPLFPSPLLGVKMYATPGLSPPLTFGAESAAEPESRMVVGTYGSLGGPGGDDMAGVASARKTADDAARLKMPVPHLDHDVCVARPAGGGSGAAV